MNKRILTYSVLMTTAMCSAAMAVGPGKTLDFTDSTAGPVIFDGSTHQAAGLSCKDCHHDGLFPKMKKGTVRITMKDLNAGKYCGKCHDGTNAFSSTSCDRCHYKAGV